MAREKSSRGEVMLPSFAKNKENKYHCSADVFIFLFLAGFILFANLAGGLKDSSDESYPGDF